MTAAGGCWPRWTRPPPRWACMPGWRWPRRRRWCPAWRARGRPRGRCRGAAPAGRLVPALRAAGRRRSAGRAVDRRHRQHASAWWRDRAAARPGAAGWPPRGSPRGPRSRTRRARPTPWPGSARGDGRAAGGRGRTALADLPSRRCGCRRTPLTACVCWGSSGSARLAATPRARRWSAASAPLVTRGWIRPRARCSSRSCPWCRPPWSRRGWPSSSRC